MQANLKVISPSAFLSALILALTMVTSIPFATCADTIYAADVTFSPNSTIIRQFTPNGMGSIFGGINHVSSLNMAFDGAGDLYAQLGRSGSVYKFTPDGMGSIFASVSIGAEGLAVDSEGNVYVATVNSIDKFTPAGVGSVFATGVGSLNGLAFDAAGNLYSANTSNNTIDKFTSNGVESTFATTGTGTLADLAVDTAGNVYTSFTPKGSLYSVIEKYSTDGVGSVFATQFGFAPSPTKLQSVGGLAFDSTGDLFVTASTGGGNVVEFSPTGGLGSVFAILTQASGIAIYPVPEPSTWALLVIFLPALFRLHSRTGRTA